MESTNFKRILHGKKGVNFKNKEKPQNWGLTYYFYYILFFNKQNYFFLSSRNPKNTAIVPTITMNEPTIIYCIYFSFLFNIFTIQASNTAKNKEIPLR